MSSGIIQSPDYTMEQLVAVARGLRTEHRFNGYIHLKAIPGASREIMHEAGCWADRLSANVELPTQDDLTKLAPEKQLVTIRQTMGGITSDVERSKEELRAASKIVSCCGRCTEESFDEAIEICAGGAEHADGCGRDRNERRDDFEFGFGFIFDAWAASNLLLGVQPVSEGGFAAADSGAAVGARASAV